VTDEELMQLAIAEAWKGIESGNGEVGAVIASGGKPVFRGYNRINSSSDVTGHAEIDALRAVSKGADTLDLSAYTLYCTLEPCGMCTCACAWAHLGRIVYGAPRSDVPARYFELDGLSCSDLLRASKAKIELTPDLLRDRCLELYAKRR
jgi:tRNA(adenine34) deaminase